MNKTKNVLIVIGVIAIILFLALLVMGIKIAGTIFMYVIGALAIVFVVGWIVYLVTKPRKNRS